MREIVIQGHETKIVMKETETMAETARALVEIVNTAVLLHIFKVNGKYANGELPHSENETLNDQEIVDAIRQEIANALPKEFTIETLIVRVYERSGFTPKGHTNRYGEIAISVRAALITLEWTNKTLLGTVRDSFMDMLCMI